jgi:glycosyltransferase involved in cell wall biosynthesis
MKVSVIIPTLNEEELIAKTLGPLRGYEVIVVDGGSRDRTVSLAKQLGARVVVAEGLNIPESRNLGSSLASGDLLIQLDADTFIDGEKVAAVESVLAEPDVVGGTFRLYPYDGEWYHKAFAAFVYIALLVMSRTPVRIKPRLGGAVVFMRRAAFEAIGKYWSNPVCEDQYIAKMLAGVGRFVYVNEIVYTSARRLVKWGFLRGIFKQTLNSALVLLFGRTLMRSWEPINK